MDFEFQDGHSSEQEGCDCVFRVGGGEETDGGDDGACEKPDSAPVGGFGSFLVESVGLDGCLDFRLVEELLYSLMDSCISEEFFKLLPWDLDEGVAGVGHCWDT